MYGKGVLFCRVVRIRSINVRFKSDSTKKLLAFLADMPKSNSSRITEAQRQRQHIARKCDKYGPSSVYLQVLGSGARGAPNTLYLFTDQKRYLFNCGECTQRLAHEHKVKLSRLDHIFITNKTWRNIGGLPGLSLTLQDVGVPNITLHGPEGMDELYNATKRFVIMKDMQVTMAKCNPTEDFEDNVMSVKYVVLGPNDDIIMKDIKDLKPAAKKQKLADTLERGYEEFVNDNTDYYRSDDLSMDVPPTGRRYVKERKRVMPPAKPSKQEVDPGKKKTDKVLYDLQKKTHSTIAYICTLKKRLGTLDLAKCVELGVKPGPQLGQLKNGHDIVLPDGTFVLSKDVKTPDDPGPVFIVLEVPEISYLKPSEFSAHFNSPYNKLENVPTLMVHFTPPHVFHHPAYQAFMEHFGPTTRHLILNEQNLCLGSEAVHRTQHKLHLLDPDIFPLLKDVSMPAVWNAQQPIAKTSSPIRLKGLEELRNKIAQAQFQNIIHKEGVSKSGGERRPPSEELPPEEMETIAGRTLTMFHLRPRRQLDRSAEPKLHIQGYIQETMDAAGFVPSLEQFRRLVDGMRYSAKSGSSPEYPKVVFLGTGSCIPSKTRNTSAMVLHIDDTRSILLDCGEGTFGQLVRFYGPKRVNSFLRTLRAIYVSHLHADHHIGLIGVLQARRQAFDEVSSAVLSDPVYLLAPGQIVSWLAVYDQQFERIRSEFTLIPNQNLLTDSLTDVPSAVLSCLGVHSIETCLVPHCPNAFGVAIQAGGHKITYSGDALPSEALVALGKDSTLLIHEATMEDELAEEARMKMHSTTTQAIEIGRQMKARYTVLTHFSQRYARLPRLNANILNDNNSVGIAFDNMQITMNDLELLPHMYAPLQLMFAEHCVEMELKAASRARHKQRTPSARSSPDLPEKVGRRRPSNCRTISLHGPTALYRESNASRLRTGLKTTAHLASPPRSPRCKTPRSRSPSKASVQRARSRPKSGISTRSRSRSRAASETDHSTSVDNNITTRTSSLSSCVENVLDEPESINLLDTRSKTINSVMRRPDSAPDPVRDVGRTAAPKTAASVTDKDDNPIMYNSSGYGAPLITPIHKKLYLNNNKRPYIPPATSPLPVLSKAMSMNSDKPNHSLLLQKPQIQPKADDSLVWSSYDDASHRVKILRLQQDLVLSGLLNVSVLRIVHIVSQLWRETLLMATIIALSVVVWTVAKRADQPPWNNCVRMSSSPLRTQDKPPGIREAFVYVPPRVKSYHSPQRDSSLVRPKSKNLSLSTTNSMLRCQKEKTVTKKIDPNSTHPSLSSRHGSSKTGSSLRPSSPVYFSSITRPTTPVHLTKTSVSHTVSNIPHKVEKIDYHNKADAKGKSVKDSKRVQAQAIPKEVSKNSTAKQLQEKFKPTVMGRPGSANHSTKSFKPQLEDIKSSFLLLNKSPSQKHNVNNAMSVVLSSPMPTINKPKPLNEEERRQQLQAIRESFQSKQYFDESKYDKIEGLNWISWK